MKSSWPSRSSSRVKICFVGLTILFFLLPVLFLFLSSFAYAWRWPEVWPAEFSFRGWQVLFREPRLLQAVGTTMLIGSCVVVFNLVLALPAARALSLYSFPGKAVVESILLLPLLIPSLAVAMGIHLTMIKVGLANQWLGVVLVHLIPTLPYSIRILRSGYDRLGTQWEEQAKSLGARKWTIFWTISVPFLLPSLRSAVILTFVISLSQYVLTALIGGGNVVTLAMIYYPYLSAVDEAVISNFSLLFALLHLLFVVLLEGGIRFLIPGKKRLITRED